MKTFFLLLFAFSAFAANAQTIRYVKPIPSGSGNGSSWANASSNLQTIINASAANDQVWVAAGTYKPSAFNRGISFALKNGVAVYGGFTGTETLLEQRDWETNLTTLSGDLDAQGNNSDNSYHVVKNAGLNSTAALDGFTIAFGNANEYYWNDTGGGMYNDNSSPTLANCIFSSNSASASGGGMFNQNASNPALTNCSFTSNGAYTGAGMHNNGSSPTLTGCTFSSHSAPVGAGMFNTNNSSPTLTDCGFSGNSASGSGGGMYNEYSSSPVLTNCSFTGNSAHIGGGMDNNYGSNPTLTDCSFSGNTVAGNGGGMNNSSSSPTLDGCTFTENFSSYYGGGMGNNSGSAPNLVDCIFSENIANVRGAGMYNNNASPMVSGCEFSQNTGAYAGSGMANSNSSSPTVTDCTFTGNSSSNWGGGMHNEESSNPTLTNCTFTSNTSEWGGAMENIFSSFPTLIACTFLGNSANYGGALDVSGSSASLTNCIFLGNSAATSGGAIRSHTGSMTITNCSFSGNTATTGGTIENYFNFSPVILNSIIWGNSSAIANGPGCNPQVSFSIVQGGHAGTDNLNLDPIFVDQPPVGLGTAGDLRLQECSPAIDEGTNSGAPNTDLDGNPRPYNNDTDMGAYERQTPVPPGANSVWFIDADSDDYGNTLVQQCDRPTNGFMLSELDGLGDCQDGNPDINPGAPELCDGIDNDCDGGIDENYVCCPVGILYVHAGATGDNDGSSWADAFTDLQSALTNTCPTFSQIWVASGVYKPTSGSDRNAAFVLKNGIAVYGGFNGTETSLAQRNWASNVTTLSGDLLGNDASNIPPNQLTGHASRSDNSYNILMNNSNGLNNTAILDGFTITGGNANGLYYLPAGNGGGMYCKNSSPALSNCMFTANSTSGGGGGVSNENASPGFTNCSFSGNYANSGGGIYNYNSSPNLNTCDFDGNAANYSGGGVYNYYYSSPSTTGCTFSNNSAGDGGGMYCGSSSNPTLNNCLFSGNTASSKGGGMYISNGSPALISCDFSNNAANEGGGMYNQQSTNLSLTACDFTENTATSRGGGMYNQYSTLNISDCGFIENTAGQNGGGMNNYSSSPTLSDCSFIGNTANSNGGGMINETGSVPNISSCSFKGNSAISGGGIINISATPTIQNCSFSGNSATLGGGLYNAFTYAPSSVINCSFSGNTASTSGGAVRNDNGSSGLIYVNCIFWGNNTEFGSGNGGNPSVTYSIVQQASGVYPGAGNLNLNPLFVQQPPIGLGATGDLRLQECSPAIDMGTNTGAPTEDFDGNPRPFNSIGLPEAQTDMGAWEYQFTMQTVTPSVAIAGPELIVCPEAGATFTATPVNGGPTPVYQWKVDGVPAGSNSPSFTSYTLQAGDVVSCTMTSSQPCAYPLIVNSNTIEVAIGTPPGDPTVFGDNVWNVYAWNAGGSVPTGNSWNVDYSGFYTATGTNFNTQNQWNAGASPSSAPGYQGCAVGLDNHSYSAKRRGFTCGYYSINIDAHDDAAQLWVDGAMVWEHTGCCDSHTGAWSGFLDEDSEVEFRVTEGTGGSNGAISFQTISPQIAGLSGLCGNASTTLSVQGNVQGNYLWSTGAATPTIAVSNAGTYGVTIDNGNGCSIQASGFVNGPAGDPAVFGNQVWNVYAWNAGGAQNSGNSWNTAYSGYYTASGLNFNTQNQWNANNSPSWAPGYQGCTVHYDNHSYSAKREGFPLQLLQHQYRRARRCGPALGGRDDGLGTYRLLRQPCRRLVGFPQ